MFDERARSLASAIVDMKWRFSVAHLLSNCRIQNIALLTER